MKVYINYKTPDDRVGSYHCHEDTVTVDTSDTSMMHFTWTVSSNVTIVKGTLSFLVCIKKTDIDGNETNHWNSELNREITISEGLECDETILEEYPDVITHILTRLSTLEALNGIDENAKLLELDTTLEIAGKAADAKVVGDEIKALEKALEELKPDLAGLVIDVSESVTLDPSSNEEQIFDVSNIVNGAAIEQAISDGRTVTLLYNISVTNENIFSRTQHTVLTNRNRYVLDDVDISYISGVMHNVYTNRYAMVELLIGHTKDSTTHEVTITYYPDPAGSNANGGSGLVMELDTTLQVSGKAADAGAVGNKISELNNAMIDSHRRMTTWNVVKNGSVVTINYTLENDQQSYSDVLTFNDAGYLTSIVSNGFESTGNWEGF
jgi:hypothetical protein